MMRHAAMGLISAAVIAGVSPSWAAPASRATPPDGYEVLAVGDILNGPLLSPIIARTSPELIRLIGHADVAFGNFENTAIDWSRYKGSPQAQSGGDWLVTTADDPRDLKAMGFDMVSRANNHGTDWGAEGLLLTDQLIDEAGLVQAGAGVSETAARAPGYYDGARARVGLVAAASTFIPAGRAADARGVVPARPGVSAIQLRKTYVVSPERLKILADIRDAIARSVHKDAPADREDVVLSDQHYRASATIGDAAQVLFDPKAADREAVLRAVGQSHRTADLTLLSVHWHEPSNQSEEPAPFAVQLAHDAIDAGGDMVVGHGPHRLRGVEIYKGHPIFYSLGDFAYALAQMQPMPREEFTAVGLDPDKALDVEALEVGLKRDTVAAYYDSVMPVVRYAGGRPAEIRLYPLELGGAATDLSHGTPRLAGGDDARRILDKLAALSRPFGTVIVRQGDVGVITIAAPEAK